MLAATLTQIQTQVYLYKVPFVHSKTGEVEWMEVEAISDRFVELQRAIAQARLDYGFSPAWKVDFDGVVAIDHPAPF